MNDLENLRKRAKQLVRQHRGGSYLVPDRIRRVLPRFAGMTDREVLDTPFALHDAQELIAVEHGFATWADLKESPPMTTSETTETNQTLTGGNPSVFVTDFDRALAFYTDMLGFEVVFTYGDPPFYGAVQRDEVHINVRHVDDSPFLSGVRDDEQLLSLSITCSDAKALFLELQAKGADFQQRLETKPWQWDEFVVRDPDGNLILFGTPTG